MEFEDDLNDDKLIVTNRLNSKKIESEEASTAGLIYAD